MNKERLIELLHLIAMGRRDKVEDLAELLTAKPEVKPEVKAPITKSKAIK